MNNLNLLRGIFLSCIAITFGLVSFNYKIGSFGKAGPGLFPLVVSCMLLLVGVTSIIKSYYVEKTPINYNFKNLAIVLLSICGFAAISHILNTMVGIVFLVFCSTFAGKDYSIIRNVKICAVLLAIAFVFEHFLNLNLNLMTWKL